MKLLKHLVLLKTWKENEPLLIMVPVLEYNMHNIYNILYLREHMLL